MPHPLKKALHLLPWLVLTACQASPPQMPATSPLPSDLPEKASSAPQPEPGPLPTPLQTALPAAPETPAPQPTPSPYPTPHLVPSSSPVPNPWPTGIHDTRPEPSPSLPIETCQDCLLSWHAAAQPHWVGEQLVYTAQQHEERRNSQSPILNRSQSGHWELRLFPEPFSNQSQEAWSQNPSPHMHDYWQIWPLGSDQMLARLGQQSSPAEWVRFRPGPNASLMPLTLGTQPVFSLSPNARADQLAWIAYNNGQLMLYRRHLDPAAPIEQIGQIQTAGAQQLAWQPDGEGWIFIETNPSDPPEAKLYQLNASGQQKVWLNLPKSSQYPERIRHFSFSPDGQHLLVVLESMRVGPQTGLPYWQEVLWLGDSKGQNLRQLSGFKRLVGQPAWHPTQAQLALVVGEGESEVPHGQSLILLDLQTEQVQALTSPAALGIQLTAPVFSQSGEWLAFLSNQDETDTPGQPLQLYRIRHDGSQIKALTQSEYQRTALTTP